MDDLMVQLGLWQVALPLTLIVVHASILAASLPGLVLRTTAIIALLLYTALAGLWLFPPWWTPYAMMLLLLVASWRLFVRLSQGTPRKMPRRIAEIVLSTALIASAGLMMLPVLQGRTANDVAIDLDMPLGAGRYLVTSGGASPEINAHLLTLGLDRAADYRGQSRGVDFIGINGVGLRASGIRPSDPRAYEIYGREVRAPCSGNASSVVDGVPDNNVPLTNRDDMAGNHVVLNCDGLAVVLAHFVPGSIRVVPGDRVNAGQAIARVGNSGNSDEPHLHIHVQTFASSNASLSGDPLWFTIEGELPVRNSRFQVEDQSDV